MTGPNFRDYHRLLDDHGEQIFAMSDVVAERIRKFGDVALRSIGDIVRHQRLHDNDAPSLIETWIDETENRAWFLYEILHRA
jgi:starvation-inducible DNA-binding protein